MGNLGTKDIKIKRVTPHDVSLYRDIRLHALQESPLAFATTYAQARKRSLASWTEQVVQSSSGSQRSTLLAMLGDRPVGMAALYGASQPGQAELLQMWVHPDFRHLGIGRDLVGRLISWGGIAGFKHIYATIHRENTGTLPFYEQLGFTLDEEATQLAPERDIILTYTEKR